MDNLHILACNVALLTRGFHNHPLFPGTVSYSFTPTLTTPIFLSYFLLYV